MLFSDVEVFAIDCKDSPLDTFQHAPEIRGSFAGWCAPSERIFVSVLVLSPQRVFLFFFCVDLRCSIFF